jgi:excisionase family DNA binding protein
MITGASESGRLDVNQRPLAAQGHSESIYGESHGGRRRQVAETTKVSGSSSSHRRAQRAPGTAPSGAPVARTFRGWLTTGEIAARLRLCRATVYRLCAEGSLKHVRVGLSIRISEDQVQAYLEAAGTEVLTRSRTRRRGRPPADAGDRPRSADGRSSASSSAERAAMSCSRSTFRSRWRRSRERAGSRPRRPRSPGTLPGSDPNHHGLGTSPEARGLEERRPALPDDCLQARTVSLGLIPPALG